MHSEVEEMNPFHFVDEMCAINDDDLFEKHSKEIYPEELDLKNENVYSTKASILDIDLKEMNIQRSVLLNGTLSHLKFSVYSL